MILNKETIMDKNQIIKTDNRRLDDFIKELQTFNKNDNFNISNKEGKFKIFKKINECPIDKIRKTNINAFKEFEQEISKLKTIRNIKYRKSDEYFKKMKSFDRTDEFMICKNKKILYRANYYHTSVCNKKEEVREYVINSMKKVYQIQDHQNILQHGESVYQRYVDLFGLQSKSWKLPSWFLENKNWIHGNIFDEEIMKEYLILHDCGKPFCCSLDEEGNNHFKDHAKWSHKIYSLFTQNIDANVIKELILRDMDIHTIEASDLDDFCRYKKIAISLLISGLCAIHSNADLFGGIDSISFKIKLKKLNQRGKQIIKKIKG